LNIGIIGAGIAGLTAAYELAHAGHKVTVYEAAPIAGGLASGFRGESSWDWPLERFYHHFFQTDKALLSLANTIGFGDKTFFRSPVTAHMANGRLSPFDTPLNMLLFPDLPIISRLRFGFAGAYLKYVTNDWRKLEQTTAVEWARRWMGQQAYDVIWKPMLEGKFGAYASEVNMAWLWARVKARSFKLGYFEGGFQAFVDALLNTIKRMGVDVRLATPVEALERSEKVWKLSAGGCQSEYDRVVVTGAPRLLSKLAPDLPKDYLGQLSELKSLGAVVLVLALKQKLTDYYWIQGMQKPEYPFLALVEHTNFIDAKHYGGDHLVYCGDYLPADHEYFRMTQDQLIERFLPAISRFNPNFKPDWIKGAWLQREPYAQPVVTRNHSKRIPPLATPLEGLYWASMSQVYPWDRGTNFAVELGQDVAREVLKRPV
jgi:Protoporphyrinogen oxidase